MWRWWRHCDAVYLAELVLLCFPRLNIPFSNKKIQKAPGTYCYLCNIPYFLGVYSAKIGKMSICDAGDVTVTLCIGQSWFYCVCPHLIYPFSNKKYKRLRTAIAIFPRITTVWGSTWLKLVKWAYVTLVMSLWCRVLVRVSSIVFSHIEYTL